MAQQAGSRKNPRLRNYSYSTPGAYFVTLCTDERRNLLGEITQGCISLSRIGELCQQIWLELPNFFSWLSLDAYVVMPNHLHGILNLTQLPHGAETLLPSGTVSGSLGAVIQAFKSRTSRLVHEQQLWSQPVWQRGYYDHVIRNEESLARLRDYISHNPLKWDLDRENPLCKGVNQFYHWLDYLTGQIGAITERVGRSMASPLQQDEQAGRSMASPLQFEERA